MSRDERERSRRERSRTSARKTLLVVGGAFGAVAVVSFALFAYWALTRDPLEARVGQMYHVEAGPSKFSLICRDEDTVGSINAAINRYDVAATATAHAERGAVGLLDESDRVEVVSIKGRFARVEVITGVFKGDFAWVDKAWLRHWSFRQAK